MAIDKILAFILSSRPDLTRADVEKMIQIKKKGAGGLLTDEGAAYLVAMELGVKLPDTEKFKTSVAIKDLVADLNDVSITGRVLLVYPVRSFTRSDGSEGKVSKLLIADKTGLLRVVLWDERTSIVSQNELSPNQIIKILHGYVRRGLDDELELHVGRNGKVIASPPDIEASDYPKVESFFKKIVELSEGDRYVNILGVISRLSPIITFKRSDGSEGRIMRVRLVDETGKVSLILWNDRIDDVVKAKRGWFLRATAARVKRGIGGEIEVHAGKGSKITVSPDVPVELKLPLPSFTRISELKPNMPDVDVLSRVVSVGQIRRFERASGEAGQVADLIINDGSGSVRLVVWDEHAEVIKKISPGDLILIEGAYTREGATGLSLNLGRWGTIKVNPNVQEKGSYPGQREEDVD